MDVFNGLLEKAKTPMGGWDVGSLYFEPSYIQAGLVIFLVFLLVLTMARLRFLYVHWNLGRSAVSMAFWGFILAIILEGFLILGGRTIFTEILGWESAPKPINNLLGIARKKMVKVLGVETKTVTKEDVIDMVELLPQKDRENLQNEICSP